MQLVAYGVQDVYLSGGPCNYYSGHSTTFHRGKTSRFAGKHNFYEHIKKPGNKITRKSARINIRERGPVIDEYSGKGNNSRYLVNRYYESTIPEHMKLFSSDKVCINKGIYVNNNRKYRNFELLFQYSKSDYYQYLTNSLNDIIKTKI